MHVIDWLLGKPLQSAEAEENKIKVWGAIPVLGLDALSSAAYGPEAAMTILLPLGVAGLVYTLPIVGIITLLLMILYFSYRQTMHAYPSGGGSYTVAKSNLGKTTGLFAAAALMIDYILTAAVGISAGVGALISAVPHLHHHILSLCLAVLVLITLVNLRGVRETGGIFAIPTYLFVFSLLAVLAYGIFRVLTEGGHPTPVEVPPLVPKAAEFVTPWLLMRAFASGCTAMTGVEAVSNGIQAFEQPRVGHAQKTLTWIVALLALMLIGIAYLSRFYHVGATDPSSAHYQSVISQLVAAIAGRGTIYYVTLFSVIAVLALSANTGFADFPRLCHLLAEDEFLPHFFTVRGRRLVYSAGILILASLCGILLTIFGGITDNLIPLFAIGAFLAFTLSQAGMVMHWLHNRDRGWKASLAINGVGAVCTAVALGVVLVAKFVEGAWITVLLIPTFVAIFMGIERHYRRVHKLTECDRSIMDGWVETEPVVLVPIKEWSLVSRKALKFALTLSTNVVALHIDSEDDDPDNLDPQWTECVVKPLEAAGKKPPELRLVKSPFRRFIQPTLAEVQRLANEDPKRRVIVVIPQLVESTWLQLPLHNQRSNLLKAALFFAGGPNVIVANVPWYLDKQEMRSRQIPNVKS